MIRPTTTTAVPTRTRSPRISRCVRWARTPPGGLVLAAAASGLCGLFLHPQGFVVCFGALAVMTVGLVWPWLSVRGLSGLLAFDRSRCCEGETVALRLTLRNRIPWGVWGVSIKGGLHEPGADDPQGDAFGGVAFARGRCTTLATIRFTPNCRGVYPGRAPRVACGFPFGLWEADRPLELAAPLVVWPRTFPVALVPEAQDGRGAEGLALRDRAGNWGDPLGVRPYRRGDPFRRVHWGQTARRGELIVCEVQSNAAPRVQVVLDTHPAAHAGAGPDGSREWAIRVAASFVEKWAGQGADVDLVFPGSVSTQGGSAWARTAAALDALARLAPDEAEDLSALLNRPECRRFQRGLRLIVTTNVGLRDLTGSRAPRVPERLVVLHAQAFGTGAHDQPFVPLPMSPWIRIDGPEQVAARLRRTAQEVALVH